MRRWKYPKTPHLPWSESSSATDTWSDGVPTFPEIVITEKLDGEATTIYSDGYVHARSIDSSHHSSRSWVKKLAASISYLIPEGYRICGENLFAYHSIFYTDLPSYFFVYGIYNEEDCLAWNEVEKLCQTLGLLTVPVLYRGEWIKQKFGDLLVAGSYPIFDGPSGNPTDPEGFVVRNSKSFSYFDFHINCTKYVRKEHVKDDQNWMSRPVVPNLLSNCCVYSSIGQSEKF